MYNRRTLLGLLAMQAAILSDISYPHEDNPVSFDPKNIKKPISKIPKGLKKFDINGVEVWALNLKNAKRKALAKNIKNI